MKRFYLKNIFLCLCLLIGTKAFAYNAQIDGIYYNFSGDEAKVTYNIWGSANYSGIVVIPSSVTYNDKTYSVTSIENYAFRDCSSLTSVTIPNTVTSIGVYAFEGCSGLSSIAIPESLIRIGSNAFSGTAWYENQPDGLVYAGKVAYKYKGEMPTGAHIAIKNGTVGIADEAFYRCSALTSVEIPEGVTSIGDEAFYHCDSLTSVTIPNSVTSIGNEAFYYCRGLTSVTIPNTVTKIGYGAFEWCSGLASITIPESLTSIGSNAFSGTAWYENQPDGLVYAGKVAYKYKHGYNPWDTKVETRIAIKEGTLGIAEYAFSYCDFLTTIIIPQSVTNIGENAFNYCNLSLVIVKMKTPVNIDRNVFTNSANSTLYVPIGSLAAYQSAQYWQDFKAIKEIKEGNPEIDGIDGIYYKLDEETATAEVTSAHDDNNVIKGKVVIPSSISYDNKSYRVTSIGNEAFNNCIGLTSITIPSSVTSIGNKVFSHCIGLASVAIPSSVTSIGTDAFWGCYFLTSSFVNNTLLTSSNNWGALFVDKETDEGLLITGTTVVKCRPWATSVTIPNSVMIIESGAFSGCSDLTSIAIPDSLTRIGNNAFSGTAWYENQPDGLVYAGKVAYEYKGQMPEGTHITIKSGTIGIAGGAFYGSNGLTAVDIPKGVTSIGEDAFSSCYNLATITIPNSVTWIGRDAFRETAWYENQPYGLVYAGLIAYEYKKKNKEDNPPVGTHIVIKDGTLGIADEAFEDLRGLTYITIPNSVIYIGDEAFFRCRDLTSVTIPESVTSIGFEAFIRCEAMTSVIIGSGVTSIGEKTFSGCNNLTTVTVRMETPVAIGEDVFSNRANATLSVPLGRVPAYQAAKYWNEFKEIKEMEIPNPKIDGIYYHLDEENMIAEVVQIPGNAKYSGEIVIPSSITYENKTYSVTSIGNWAFGKCAALTSVTIPNSVRTIGDKAFGNCSSLTFVNLGNGVTTFGEGAFFSCTGLTSISIPESVTTIGESAFSGCTNLATITIPNSVTRIGYDAFLETAWYENQPYGLVYAGLIAYEYKKKNKEDNLPVGTHIVIKDGTLGIADEAFEDLRGLTYITIPNSVIYIGKEAFFRCCDLTSVTIPESVTSIGFEAFFRCEAMTSVTIGCGVTSIGEYAFYGCDNLTTVTVKMETPVAIGGQVFSNRTNATLNVPFDCVPAYQAAAYWKEFKEIKESVPEVDGIFYRLDRNKMLAEVIAMPDNAKYSGNVTIPSSILYSGGSYRVVSIGNEAFRECTGLTSVTIAEGVANIGRLTFYKCSGLATVVIPNSVTTISYGAFAKCSSLTSLSVGNGVKTIGDFAFESCSGLTSFNIPEKVKSLGIAAFQNCNGLTSVALPNGLTDIGGWAFFGCSGLSSLTIPESVTSIDSLAFYGCSGLSTVTIPKRVPSIEYGTFADCSGLSSVTIGCGVKNIGDYAFEGCTNLIIVHSEITEPFAISNNVFPYENATLYVPQGTKRKYKITPGWMKFKAIDSGVLEDGDVFMAETVEGIEMSFMVISYDSKTCQVNAGEQDIMVIGNRRGKVTIPSIAKGYAVTSICEGAFRDCELDTIYIPNTVTTIERDAFRNCMNLKSLVLPNGLVNIGMRAFDNCSSLQDIVIPNSVKNIGEYAFANCMSLYAVTSLINIPFILDDSAFAIESDAYDRDIMYSITKLYVPIGRENVYKITTGWKKFMTIAEKTMSNKLTYILDGEVYKTFEVQAGEVITPEPAPVKEGHNFSGWSEIPYLMPDHDVTVMGNFTIDPDYETGVGETVGPEPTAVSYYTEDGRRIPAPKKGLNIIRMSDGTTKKVMVK